MGVIFRRTIPVELVEASVESSIQGWLQAALMEPAPADAATATTRANQMARDASSAVELAQQKVGSVSIQPIPFAIAVALFFVLLGVAIVLDWKNVVDDATVYSNMATTVLGVIVGFLGGDAVGTGSSS